MTQSAIAIPTPPSGSEAPAISLAPETPAPNERCISTRTGFSAVISERDGDERIEVRDATSRLVFELDPQTGRMMLSPTASDLALCAGGNVDIVAGGTLRCRGAEKVLLETGEGEERAALSLRKSLLELSSRTLRVAATRLFEHAKTAYRRVDELHQLKAGRTRTLVDGGHDIRAGHASMTAREELKLDGTTIHLG